MITRFAVRTMPVAQPYWLYDGITYVSCHDKRKDAIAAAKQIANHGDGIEFIGNTGIVTGRDWFVMLQPAQEVQA